MESPQGDKQPEIVTEIVIDDTKQHNKGEDKQQGERNFENSNRELEDSINTNTDDGEEEQEERCCEDFDWRKLFRNALSAINLEALKSYAVEVRLRQFEASNAELVDMSCEIIGEPLCGSYNLVYVIEFIDKVKWIARVPIQGTRVKAADIDRLNTDYSTLKYVREVTKIPVPDVYAFETSCGTIGVPFALMSFVSGEAVCARWFDKEWITEDKRLKILSNLARVMANLQRLKFLKVGTLRFSDKKTITHIGPMHTLAESEEEYIEEGIIRIEEYGPFESVSDWLDYNPDTFEDLPETALWAKGCLEVMRLAMESIPPYLRRSDRCEIDVPDYNYQNILIDDDCNITALLDWDGVSILPQGMGCTRYPSWITRDWDPAKYETPQDENGELDENGDWAALGEDKPDTLSKYRKHYADSFASLNPENYDARQTSVSHILEAIKIGIDDRFSRQYIMSKLLDHAYGPSSWPWEYSEITLTLKDPSTPAAKAMRKQISKQFEKMWHAEWETPQSVEGRKGEVAKGYLQHLTSFLKSRLDRLLGLFKN